MTDSRRPIFLLWRTIKLLALALLVLWLGGILVYRFIDPPLTPLMLLRLGDGVGIDHASVALGQVSASLPRAVIAAEDNRFCLHHGIDFAAIQDAIDEHEDGRALRGASTITMQLARNLFLWPGGGFLRKGIEAATALAIDALWPKRRQVEVYLNIVEWAPGVYGAEAAARHHFRKPAARLTARESALLAATLPSPRRWSASQPGSYVQNRADIIQQRVGQLGALLACIG
ncbi:MAG: monofunctional biosynthetic peptidoglycan transglycosylase [Alphaproteobacteria bacterium]|nr:monofunctional biosynthetic peptidoglycan transglycosylase [Alphaproteobacteria bacterium]